MTAGASLNANGARSLRHEASGAAVGSRTKLAIICVPQGATLAVFTGDSTATICGLKGTETNPWCGAVSFWAAVLAFSIGVCGSSSPFMLKMGVFDVGH